MSGTSERQTLLAGVMLLFIWGQQICLADSSYDQGVRLYNERKFQQALVLFQNSFRQDERNSNAAYFIAICNQQLGDYAKARAQFKTLVAVFPGSEAARLSEQALTNLQPPGSAAFKPVPQLAVVSAAADVVSAPKETWIPFRRQGNALMVEASVNHQGITMVFDTGAAACVFSKEQLRALGIVAPSGQPVTSGAGVGSSGGVPLWKMSVDLEVGRIRRQNFPVFVQAGNLDHPLLGQTFFADFEYTVDNANNAISFKKKHTGSQAQALAPRSNQAGTVSVNSSGNYVYCVPFEREGNNIVVVVNVNGKSCPMYFDTGAAMCFFTSGQLRELGISVPTRVMAAPLSGVGGSTVGIAFPIERMKMGPIDKSSVIILVSDSSAVGKPLLGQNFFQDWLFTIDNDSRSIQFTKR